MKKKLTQLLFNRFKSRPCPVTTILRKKETTIKCHTPAILPGINYTQQITMFRLIACIEYKLI